MSYPYPVSVIPGPNDAFSLSQGQIQTNFANLIGWSGVDHYAYGDTNAGTHEQVTFSNVTTQTVPADPVSVLYTKNDINSHPQLFFLNSQNNAFYVRGQPGSTALLGGIILQWGVVNVPGGGTAVATFTVPFPNVCFNVQCTAAVLNTSLSVSISNILRTSVTIYLQNGSGTQTVYWLAIGA